jgi:hypothetical protein
MGAWSKEMDMQTRDIKLPLAYSSHRLIVDADGNLAIEVFSGGPGIDAADQLQELVVVACNSHEQLVVALRKAEEALARCYDVTDFPGDGTSNQDIALAEVRAALAAAGAA